MKEASDREYWSLDVPGLTYESATRARDLCLNDAEVDTTWGVVLIDPSVSMTRGFDLSTVELLAKCLRAGLADGSLHPMYAAGAQSMLEDFEEWLKQADRG